MHQVVTEWVTWTSDGKLAAPTYATGGSVTTTGSKVSIYSSDQIWPYSWSVSSSSSAYVEFKLNQFGTVRQQRLTFRAKRAGILNQNVNNYLVGIFSGNGSIASCTWGPVTYSWATDYCLNGSPYNGQLNYSGGWNSMMLSITGDGFGGTIDLLDVNWIKLSIEP